MTKMSLPTWNSEIKERVRHWKLLCLRSPGQVCHLTSNTNDRNDKVGQYINDVHKPLGILPKWEEIHTLVQLIKQKGFWTVLGRKSLITMQIFTMPLYRPEHTDKPIIWHMVLTGDWTKSLSKALWGKTNTWRRNANRLKTERRSCEITAQMWPWTTKPVISSTVMLYL